MSGKKLYIIVAIALIAGLLNTGCIKIETLPQLEIQVVDETGAIVSGASVALFDSSDEWNKRINPVQVWRQTDTSGKVLFVDLKEIKYFVYVRYDGKDNSVDEVSTDVALEVNTKKVMTIHIR